MPAIGLMDYNARWYSPSLGRFTQPDTIIPNPINPQTLNRYSYVANNPINLVDPSGHAMCGADDFDDCRHRPERRLIVFTADEGEEWDEKEKRRIERDAYDAAVRLAEELDLDPFTAWYRIYGNKGDPLNVRRVSNTCAEAAAKGLLGPGNENCGGWGATRGRNLIWIFSNATPDRIIDHPRFIVHELGHAFDWAVHGARSSRATTLLPGSVTESRAGLAGTSRDLEWQFSGSDATTEIFADLFVAWVYDKWDENPITGALTADAIHKRNEMNVNMSTFVSDAAGQP